MTAYPNNVVTGLVLGDTVTTNGTHGHSMTDLLIIGSPRPSPTMRARVTIAETMKLRTATATNGLFHYVLRAALKMQAASGVGSLHLLVRAAFKLGATATARTLVTLADHINFSARLSVKGLFVRSIADTLKVAGYSAEGWAMYVQERLALTAGSEASYAAIVALTEQMILDGTSRVFVRCQVVAGDDIAIGDDLQALRSIYRQKLVEVVDFEVRLRQPNGTVTTWAMNARTGAVTEYQDYAFNSIVKRPDGNYLGAGDDGNLYILQGGTDNGNPVVADIVGGMLDMGGSHFTQLKAVYLGVRVSGARQSFFLKLTTNNDVTRTYQVIPKSQETARFDIGKGLRSRYIQWELLSCGQDFDLDDLEFVPLVSTRRI